MPELNERSSKQRGSGLSPALVTRDAVGPGRNRAATRMGGK